MNNIAMQVTDRKNTYTNSIAVVPVMSSCIIRVCHKTYNPE